MARILHMAFDSHSVPFEEQHIFELTTSHFFCTHLSAVQHGRKSLWGKRETCQTHDYKCFFLTLKHPLEYIGDESLNTSFSDLAAFSGLFF